MSDDQLSEHLDPELDPVEAQAEEDELPGPLSLSHLFVGIHLLAAAAVAPFWWVAFQTDNLPQTLILGALMLMLVAAGVVTGRIARRRRERARR